MRPVAITLLALALASCKREPPDEVRAAASAAVLPPAPPAPVDHLAPGELIEGTEKIFALPVPRVMKVEFAARDQGVAQGMIEPERVANYVRARVQDGKITAGASSTLFDGVHHASEPNRILRIRIEKARGLCKLIVMDVTPPPPQPDPGSDEARWRAAGFTPQGKPLDPMHMQ